MLSRAARITERIGVEVDGFETAGVSVQTSKAAYEATHTAYKLTTGLRPTCSV
jgi:hypothetical protein